MRLRRRRAQQRENQHPGRVRTDDEEDTHRGCHHLNEPIGARNDPFGQCRIIAAGQQPATCPPRYDARNGGHRKGDERPHVYRSIVTWPIWNPDAIGRLSEPIGGPRTCATLALTSERQNRTLATGGRAAVW